MAHAPALKFDFQKRGVLTVFRTPRVFDREARRVAAALSDQAGNPEHLHDPERVLSPDDCVRAEPALGPAQRSGKVAGGLLAASAATGDAHQFSQGLAEICKNAGVDFRFGVVVTRLVRVGGAITGVDTADGFLEADAVVLALGSHSPTIARTVEVVLPIIPVKGYSVTLANSGDGAPRLGILDAERKVVVAPVNGGLRAAGTAEFAGYDQSIDLGRAQAIARVAHDLFPELGPLPQSPSDLNPWAGLRPMTPDGPPILGSLPASYGCTNLFLNTGHGPLGWTLACGSAKLVADWVDGSPPDDPSGLSFARFH